jgi:hypothetical protein
MRAIYQGWLGSGLTCRKRWLHPMPKTAMTHSNANISSRSATSNVPQRFSNRVSMHAAHNCEHDCHDSSTLCRGCTHSPWVTIILGS